MRNSYPDYSVENISTFADLYHRMQGFSNEIAFVDSETQITYHRFCDDIRKVSSLFSSLKNQYVLLNLKSKYLFSVTYFATVLTGNIACLQPFSEVKLPCFANINFSLELNDSLIIDAISNCNECTLTLADNSGIATVLCSSGTMSTPKAVALSESNIISDLIAGMQKYEFPNHGVYVNILPYTHAFGLVCDLLAPLYSASTIFLTYDIMTFFATLPVASPTALNITPGLVDALCKRIQACNNKEVVLGTKLKKILSGGAGTPKELCETMQLYSILVCGCYGLSECAPCVCVNRDNYYKFGSAGIALNCNTLSIESSGEIKVSGTNVMLGYLDSEGNIENERKGVYKTGDIGYIDEEGFLFVQGRVDDLIVFSDGHKLMPQIVEAEIAAIIDVIESVVYLENGKLTATIVTNNTSTDEIEKYILKSSFGGYKVMQLHFTNEPLARNALGKLNRRQYGTK